MDWRVSIRLPEQDRSKNQRSEDSSAKDSIQETEHRTEEIGS
jgi:hypothetical protein